MEFSLAELQAKSDKALVDFLRTDLDIGFTYVRLAQTEERLQDRAGREEAILNAIRAIDTVKYFSPRIRGEEQVQEIETRLAELKQLVSMLSESA